MDYCIISDGSCDLPAEAVAKHNITVVPFYTSFDGKTYEKEEVGSKVRAFYAKMVANPGLYPTSSTPSPQDYLDAFRPKLAEGLAIICICITRKFSSSFQSAQIAKEMILDDYPEAKIEIIDSTINTVLQGLFVLEAAKLCRCHVPFHQAVSRLLEIRESGRIFFTIGSLDYLQKGGRIGELANKVSSILSIRPLIALYGGEIHLAGIARGRKRSLESVIDITKKYVGKQQVNCAEYAIAVGYGYDREEAEAFRAQLLKTLNWQAYGDQILLYQIGATIGVHTGPHPLGVGLIRHCNTDIQ